MIEQLFRRRFWVLHVIFLTVAACISALCVASIVAYILRASLPDAPKSTQATSLLPAEEGRDFTVANTRNLFGARREIVEDVEPGAVEQEVAKGTSRDLGQWQDAVESSLPVKLVGTAVFVNSHFSLASIVPEARTQEVSLYSINLCQEGYLFPCNRLLDSAEVVRIEANPVYLYNEKEHRYEYLKIDMESQLAKKTQGAAPKAAVRKKAKAQDGEIREIADFGGSCSLLYSWLTSQTCG